MVIDNEGENRQHRNETETNVILMTSCSSYNRIDSYDMTHETVQQLQSLNSSVNELIKFETTG